MMMAQENGFPTVGKNTARDALIVVAKGRAYHPVRDYLNGLEWDGTERLNRLFFDYFPARLPDEPTEAEQEAAEKAGKLTHYDEIVAYYEATAKCFMVGAVKRVFTPGCKIDCLPVLIGDQGWNKSQGVQALVPDPAWFSDDVSTALIDRDTKESLSGKWILELAEFPHIRKEVDKVKAFFSRQTDRYRRAYDRLNRDWKRQCVFMATANDLEFIDPTGNRRFWPILMSGPADVEKIITDRGQFWAEAMHWLHAGFEWWLTPSLEAIAAEMQANFLEDDVLETPISEWIELHHPDDADGQCAPFSTPEVLKGLGYALRPGRDLLGHPLTVASKADHMRVSSCLKRLSYVRDKHPRTMPNGRRERCWKRRK
jgi:predicted P-loop ATPase